MKSRRIISALPLAGLLLCATFAVAQSSKNVAADKFRAQVVAISAGADSAARREAITKRLDELRVKYRLEPFSKGEVQGTNIVTQPSRPGRKEMLLTAHYDRVSVGSGAVDNASGSATVLELLARLKKKPLKNYSVSGVFFDLEEIGLVGSGKYVEARAKSLPAVAINFDVFGYGDTLWVGAGDPKTGSAASVEQAATTAKFPLQLGPGYPPSDHLSFVKVGVEAISFSLIDGSEIPAIQKVLASGRLEVMPRVLTIIHSAGDTPDKIDAPAVLRAIPVVEKAFRVMDARK